MFKFIVIFSIFLSLLDAKLITRTKVIMGTFVSISLEEKYQNYIENSFDIMKKVDLSLSSYNIKAQIYMLNKNKKTSINKYTYEALHLSKKYYKQSNGYFDITIGSITKDLYAFGENEHLATKTQLQNAVVNFKALRFDKQNAYLDNNITVDLGGMGKGFAVDNVVEYLKSVNIKKAIVAASGDIRCIDTCKINVNNPFSDKALLSFKTSKSDTGISTSGNYNRYVKSKKNNHLINPKSRVSQDKFISITLISNIPNSDLDAYSTAASVMPLKKAYKFLNSFELAYVILQSDGKLVLSENFVKFTRDLVTNYAVKKKP